MNYFPIALALKDKRVIVVGGGEVAERKIRSLLETGARIRVISPSVTLNLRCFVKDRVISWVPRPVCRIDIDDAMLIVAATDNKSVNERVSKWARKRRIPVNVVDDLSFSDFISPALFRINKAIVTVYSDGTNPRLSKDLKNYLKEKWDDFLSYRHRL